MSNCNEIKIEEIKIKDWHFSLSDPFALLEVIKETKSINDRVNNKTFLSKEQEEQAKECVKDVRGIVTSAADKATGEQTMPSQEVPGKTVKQPLSTPKTEEQGRTRG